jgi:hypothetical protein
VNERDHRDAIIATKIIGLVPTLPIGSILFGKTFIWQ